jgi:hypothetical protein
MKKVASEFIKTNHYSFIKLTKEAFLHDQLKKVNTKWVTKIHVNELVVCNDDNHQREGPQNSSINSQDTASTDHCGKSTVDVDAVCCLLTPPSHSIQPMGKLRILAWLDSRKRHLSHRWSLQIVSAQRVVKNYSRLARLNGSQRHPRAF